MNKQKGSIILIILLLLAGAGLVFVGYKYVSKQNAQKTITPTPYPIETIEPTSSWKTYINGKYGFEFKYPGWWFSDTCNSDYIFVLDPNKEIVCATEPYEPIQISFEPDKDYNSKEKIIGRWQYDGYTVSPKSNNLLNNASEYTLEIADKSVSNPQFAKKFDLILVPIKENLFLHIVTIDDQYQNITDQILSTFQFLDQKSTSCEQNGGTWDEQYKECAGITKEVCGKIKGSWVECGSPCRHEPNAQLCIQSCALYCQL